MKEFANQNPIITFFIISTIASSIVVGIGRDFNHKDCDCNQSSEHVKP